MKACKYSIDQANKIDQGTKVIYKYPSPTKLLDIGKMTVNGRHPKDGTFIVEHDCSFVMYILSGTGKVYVGDEIFELLAQDVVFVPSGNKFAVEGALEYVTVDMPAFYPEQSEEVAG